MREKIEGVLEILPVIILLVHDDGGVPDSPLIEYEITLKLVFTERNNDKKMKMKDEMKNRKKNTEETDEKKTDGMKR